MLLLGSKQELVFGTHVLVIEKILQDKPYIKCLMSPLSAKRLMGDIRRVRNHERGNE